MCRFAQSLLCKVVHYLLVQDSGITPGIYSGLSPYSPLFIIRRGISQAGTYTFKIDFEDGGGTNKCNITIKDLSSNTTYHTINYNDADKSYTRYMNAGVDLSIYSGVSGSSINFKSAGLYQPVSNQSAIPGYASSIINIGQKGGINIYGIFDGKYKGGIMIEKSTSATTGSITPGNFVGYITVNLNGEIVKIPYYS